MPTSFPLNFLNKKKRKNNGLAFNSNIFVYINIFHSKKISVSKYHNFLIKKPFSFDLQLKIEQIHGQETLQLEIERREHREPLP